MSLHRGDHGFLHAAHRRKYFPERSRVAFVLFGGRVEHFGEAVEIHARAEIVAVGLEQNSAHGVVTLELHQRIDELGYGL